jgi:hypothetical protein
LSPPELAAEFHQLRELAPAFGVRTLRQSIERAATEAMECGDAETRELGTVARGSVETSVRSTPPKATCRGAYVSVVVILNIRGALRLLAVLFIKFIWPNVHDGHVVSDPAGLALRM